MRKIKILSFIALIAVFGFSMAACKNNDDENLTGKLKIEGLPSEYDNYFICFYGPSQLKMDDVIGMQRWTGDKIFYPKVELPKISDGSVTLSLFLYNEEVTNFGNLFVTFEGTDELKDLEFYIFKNASYERLKLDEAVSKGEYHATLTVKNSCDKKYSKDGTTLVAADYNVVKK